MVERVTRINDCKIELKSCSDEELYSMAEFILEKMDMAKEELACIREELQGRISMVDMPLEEVTGE